MPVTVAKTAGFCFGVRRAVDTVYRQLEESCRTESPKLYTLGEIIHNPQVVEELNDLGAVAVEQLPELLTLEQTEKVPVIIRSHGESREVLEELQARGAEIVSATCPNVRHIQILVTEAEAAGRQVVIIGEHDHPEVQGIASWCRGTKIFGNAEEVAKWAEETAEIADLPITMVAQTTCIRALWESCVKFLKKECTNLKIDDTICNATQKRQSEAAVASSADVMVVVGDRKSANTRHLTEICKENCTRVYQIEDADELSPDMFHGCTVAGLTAGASTPWHH